MTRMLGRLARRHDKPTVHLADYLDAPHRTAPESVAPPQVDDWGMLLNDQLGCCTCSAVGHLIDAWNADEQTNRICPRDDDVLALYRMVTGGEDSGAQCIDVLDAWRMVGMAGDKVTAYVEVDPRRREHVRLSIWQLGGLYCGVTLPKGTMEQTDAGQPWSLDGIDLDEPLGGHCVTPETRILTADLRWIAAGDLSVGDGVLAFDENIAAPKRRRYFRHGIVQSTSTLTLPSYELVFEDGTTVRCAYDHKWLAGGRSTELRWLTTEQLRPVGPSGEYGSVVSKPFDVWGTDRSWAGGYLAGAFDGEGWLDNSSGTALRLGFDQRDNEMLATMVGVLAEKGYGVRKNVVASGWGNKPLTRLRLNSKKEAARLLGSARPRRLLEKFDINAMGAMHGEHVRLVEKRPLGNCEVIAIETDARTYIAEGLASHNCVPIVGYDADGLTCVTWGKLQRMTWSWFASCCDESFGVWDSQDWFGDVPGLDAQGLIAALQRLNDAG